mgnify:CR=1 FL=1
MQRSDPVKLWIIRHGQAAAAESHEDDSDRPLTELGRAQAGWLGRVLSNPAHAPHRVIASPAVRTLTTARLICEVIQPEPDEHGELSCAHGLGEAVQAVAEVFEGSNPGCGAMVGHISTFSTLVRWLIGSDGVDGVMLRTGQAALVEIRCSPTELSPGCGELLEICRRPS